MGWMDRWADWLQRRSDEQQRRWEERQRERARSGRTSVMDRWAAWLQRRSYHQQAHWNEVEQFRRQVPTAPITGPGGKAMRVRVEMAGLAWLGQGTPAATGGIGGGLYSAALLVSLMIWRFVLHGAYTVHVRTGRRPVVKVNVRLPNDVAAYRAAAELISRFQTEGPDSIPRWRAEVYH